MFTALMAVIITCNLGLIDSRNGQRADLVFRAHASRRAWEYQVVRICEPRSVKTSADPQPDTPGSPRVSSATVYCLLRAVSQRPQTTLSTDSSPEISERPHLEVLDLHVLLLFGQRPVLPWASSSSGGRRVALRLWRYRSRVAGDLVAIHLLLVLP